VQRTGTAMKEGAIFSRHVTVTTIECHMYDDTLRMTALHARLRCRRAGMSSAAVDLGPGVSTERAASGKTIPAKRAATGPPPQAEQHKRKRWAGLPVSSELTEFPQRKAGAASGPTERSGRESPKGEALESWRIPSGSALSRSELAQRRLSSLQALQQAYKEQLDWVRKALQAQHAEFCAEHGSAWKHGRHASPSADPTNPTTTADNGGLLSLGDADVADFSDVEESLLQGGDLEAAPAHAELQAARGAFAQRLQEIERLEQLASTCTSRELSDQGASAAFACRRGRYFVRSTCFTLGRNSNAGQVDVDLSHAAGPAAVKISRKQGFMEMQKDGLWSLTNTGRRPMHVNAVEVKAGASASVPHLSLIEVGGARLIFLANQEASGRCETRSRKPPGYP